MARICDRLEFLIHRSKEGFTPAFGATQQVTLSHQLSVSEPIKWILTYFGRFVVRKGKSIDLCLDLRIFKNLKCKVMSTIKELVSIIGETQD